MITKPTVLILGAGASWHLGYPLGQDLIQNICARLKENGLPQEIKKTYSDQERHDFYMGLSRGQYGSIDAFLEENPQYIELGKILITDRLKQCENEDKLFKQPGWYRELFNSLLGKSPESFVSAPLTIVTFNYDRSLEVFLHQALLYRYHLDSASALDIVRRMRIIHPHGILGEYPEVPYTNKLDGLSLGDISKSIKIIHELKDGGPHLQEFNKARPALQEAQKIYFLGFGFHNENVRRFDFFSPENVKGKEICSSVSSIPAIQANQLKARLNMYGLNTRISSCICNEFFTEIATLD